MFPTVEVRWFCRGQAPPEIDAWFQQSAGRADRYPCREDHYLRLKETVALGIKLREGRMEIKQRVLGPDEVCFHRRVTGAVEHWHKWSFQLAETRHAMLSIAGTTASWIPVRKERLLREYRLTTDGRVVPATAPGRRSDALRQGCGMELTTVRVLGQDWWTLAFEAFGDESDLREQLLVVARHVLAAHEPPSLNAAESHGYAECLRRVARIQETI